MGFSPHFDQMGETLAFEDETNKRHHYVFFFFLIERAVLRDKSGDSSLPPHGPQTRLGDLVLPKARLNVEHQQASLRRCQKKVLGLRRGNNGTQHASFPPPGQNFITSSKNQHCRSWKRSGRKENGSLLSVCSKLHWKRN